MYSTHTVCQSLFTDPEHRSDPLHTSFTCDINIHVWIVPYALLLTQAGKARYLSPEKYAQSTSGSLAQRKSNYYLNRSFLHSVLAAQMDCNLEEVDIRYSAYGKPFLLDGPAFNLSHCERLLVVAVADNNFKGQIGVDVEARVIDQDYLTLANKCFTRLERNQLGNYHMGKSRLNAFTRGWTRKEAVVKAVGTGLLTPLNSFDVSLKRSGMCSQIGHCAKRESLLVASKLNGVSPVNCKLYDLGCYADCESSIAVVNVHAVDHCLVRVHKVDEQQLYALPGYVYG